jgi:hypothetical protein
MGVPAHAHDLINGLLDDQRLAQCGPARPEQPCRALIDHDFTGLGTIRMWPAIDDRDAEYVEARPRHRKQVNGGRRVRRVLRASDGDRPEIRQRQRAHEGGPGQRRGRQRQFERLLLAGCGRAAFLVRSGSSMHSDRESVDRESDVAGRRVHDRPAHQAGAGQQRRRQRDLRCEQEQIEPHAACWSGRKSGALREADARGLQRREQAEGDRHQQGNGGAIREHREVRFPDLSVRHFRQMHQRVE